MESGNEIGIGSGDGESQIGQDNFMNYLNNVDFKNNSKIGKNSSSRQCVICLANLTTERNEKDKDNGLIISSKDIDINVKTEPVDFDVTEAETSSAHGTNFEELHNVNADEDSLLKLLNVKVQVPFPPSPTHRNGPSQSSSCSYYCNPCSWRNKEISSLFFQIDELEKKLSSLKDGIESDFKDSFKRTLDTESNYPACINPDDIIDRKDFLRHHIAKSFNYLVIELPSRESMDLDPPVLIPDLPVDDLGNYFEDKSDIVMNDNDADADANDDEDWEPILIVPSVAFSGSESDCENDANDLDFKINVRSTKTKSTSKFPVKPRGRPPKKSKNKLALPRKYLNLKQYKQVKAGQADLTSNHATSTNVDTTDYTNLKKLHGLRKELGILVKRLPPHILAQYDVPPSADVVQNNSNNINNTNSRQLRSRLTLKASARQKQMLEMKSMKVQRNKRGQSTGTGTSVGSRSRISKADTKFKLSQARSDRRRSAAAAAKVAMPKTPLKCIFDDCHSDEIFHSFKQQEDHIRAAHSHLYEVSASEDEEEKKKKEKRTQYKCLFADCSIFEFYKTEEEMNAHIKAIHGIDMDEENDPSENEDDSGDNENDYDNSIINLDDDGDNNNMDDDFLDNQPPSPCSNLDESITTADREINAEKPRPKPNRKPYTKSKIKSENRLPSRYKCIFTDCDSQEIFHTLADRDKHVQAVHSDTLKPLEETEIEKAKRLERRERQKLRAKIIRDPNIAPKPRLHCFVEGCKSRRYFASDEEREMHMKKIHEGVTHPFECSECGRTYRSNQELGVHVKSVHLGEFSHMCHYCGKGFCSSANLNCHIVKHTGERNYKCETCLQTFKTQSGLVYHRRAIHMGDHERSHCCDRCGKSFFTAVKLNNHIKCVHNKTDKPIICEVCGKCFAIRNYLYMHMKVHKKIPENQNQGKGLSLSSVGDSADLNLSVPEGTKHEISPKKVARKRTSKPNAHHNNSSLNSSGSDMGGFPGQGQDHHHGPMEEERYLYETQDRQRQDSHNSSEMMSPTPTAGSSARLSYEPAIINIPHHHNSFNPHSESNSNLSTASGSTGTGARPGSNPPVPVDLSSNYQDQQQQHQAQYSNLNSTPHHPRGVNISRHFLCGDFTGQGPSGMIISPHPGSGGVGVGDNNPAGHGHFSNSGSIHNFLGIPGGSSSTAGHQGTAMPLQVPTSSSSTLSLQHQYLQLTSTLENLGGYHPKF